jgi:hypothetical protein
MVSGSNVTRFQRHSKEDQHLWQIKDEVQQRHQRIEKCSLKTEKKKAEFGGGRQGEERAPDVHAAVQEPNIK